MRFWSSCESGFHGRTGKKQNASQESLENEKIIMHEPLSLPLPYTSCELREICQEERDKVNIDVGYGKPSSKLNTWTNKYHKNKETARQTEIRT